MMLFREDEGENALSRTIWDDELHGDSPKRIPVVTIMGHVDHGKTTLLDHLRSASVASGEAGGITQAVSAFLVPVNDSEICFLDTPGHEAFNSMRRHGASITDIVILIVAATEGLRPQTIESINLAKSAGVPIIVAVTKIDVLKEDYEREAAVQSITSELASLGLDESDSQIIPISAPKGIGIEDLIEAIELQASLMENIRAPINVPGELVVLESVIDQAMGASAIVINRWGTTKVGDNILTGKQLARVRVMKDPVSGKQLKKLVPGHPAQISGFKNPPTPGEDILVLDKKTMRKAKSIIALRKKEDLDLLYSEHEDTELERQQVIENNKVKRAMEKRIRFFKRNGILGKELKELEDELAELIELEEGGETEAEPVTVQLILKADTDGALEALKYSIEGLNAEVQATEEDENSTIPKGSGFQIVHAGVGAVNSSDVEAAARFGAQIYGFNVRAPASLTTKLKQENVEMKTHSVIYHILDDLKVDISSTLPPEIKEIIVAQAEVKQVFEMNGKRRGDPKWKVAGSFIKSGTFNKNDRVRVVRNGKVISPTTGVGSLKIFNEDVQSVDKSLECGIALNSFEEFKEGDIIETFVQEEVARSFDGL